MYLTHKIKLKSMSNKKENQLRKGYGASRFVWNQVKAMAEEDYKNGVKLGSKFDLGKKYVAEIKSQYKFLQELPKSVGIYSVWNYHTAMKMFFNNTHRYPKWSIKKNNVGSFSLSNEQFKVNGKNLYIAKMGWYGLTEELRFDGRAVKATVSEKNGSHYVSIDVDTEIEPMEQTGEAVGVDFNIHSIDLSNGQKFEHSQFLKHDLKKLAHAQRVMSRKVKGSANWSKARRRVTSIYEKISNRRLDAHHKLSYILIKNNTVIALEDLHIRGMMKNRRLAKAIGDASFYQLSNQIEYKSKIHERELVRVGRFFPSSKTCSNCGTVKTKLSLGERVYRCEKCSLVLDRDTNAAINILNEGLTVLGFPGSNACGGTVRPELTPQGESDRLVPVKQESFNITGKVECKK